MKNKKKDFSRVKGEISGLGGIYESHCRKMMIAGLEYLDSHPENKILLKVYENVYGLLPEQIKCVTNLKKHILDSVEDCTGAQMQAVLQSLYLIQEKGFDYYVKKMNENENTTK